VEGRSYHGPPPRASPAPGPLADRGTNAGAVDRDAVVVVVIVVATTAAAVAVAVSPLRPCAVAGIPVELDATE